MAVETRTINLESAMLSRLRPEERHNELTVHDPTPRRSSRPRAHPKAPAVCR